MPEPRRRGFTLIELLVVIAIIGILAAMLFPVFARARESARKIQCLANVKNIAMAVQMYLADYDSYIPRESNKEARAYMVTKSCGGCDTAADCFGQLMNPYLKDAVLLYDYTGSKDVWRCPSARFTKTIAINPGTNGSWLQYLKDSWDASDPYAPMPCMEPFPPGWGGDVTDSVRQQSYARGGSPGVFVQNIAVPWTLKGINTSGVEDAAKYVACADAGIITNQLDRTSWVAYPDTCRIDQNAYTATCGADWENCGSGHLPDTRTCGPLRLDMGGDGKMATDAVYRKTHANARHLGGSNLGFLDGHAKWFMSEFILFNGENWSGYATTPTQLFGIGCCMCLTPPA